MVHVTRLRIDIDKGPHSLSMYARRVEMPVQNRGCHLNKPPISKQGYLYRFYQPRQLQFRQCMFYPFARVSCRVAVPIYLVHSAVDSGLESHGMTAMALNGVPSGPTVTLELTLIRLTRNVLLGTDMGPPY
jgi:hypothetical protein